MTVQRRIAKLEAAAELQPPPVGANHNPHISLDEYAALRALPPAELLQRYRDALPPICPEEVADLAALSYAELLRRYREALSE